MIGLEDMQAVRATIAELHEQPAGFDGEISGLCIGVPGRGGITHVGDL